MAGPANLTPVTNPAPGLQDTHTLGNLRIPERQSKVYFSERGPKKEAEDKQGPNVLIIGDGLHPQHPPPRLQRTEVRGGGWEDVFLRPPAMQARQPRALPFHEGSGAAAAVPRAVW